MDLVERTELRRCSSAATESGVLTEEDIADVCLLMFFCLGGEVVFMF